MIAALSAPMRSRNIRGSRKRRIYGILGQFFSTSPWPMNSFVISANSLTSLRRSESVIIATMPELSMMWRIFGPLSRGRIGTSTAFANMTPRMTDAWSTVFSMHMPTRSPDWTPISRRHSAVASASPCNWENVTDRSRETMAVLSGSRWTVSRRNRGIDLSMGTFYCAVRICALAFRDGPMVSPACSITSRRWLSSCR